MVARLGRTSMFSVTASMTHVAEGLSTEDLTEDSTKNSAHCARLIVRATRKPVPGPAITGKAGKCVTSPAGRWYEGPRNNRTKAAGTCPSPSTSSTRTWGCNTTSCCKDSWHHSCTLPYMSNNPRSLGLKVADWVGLIA